MERASAIIDDRFLSRRRHLRANAVVGAKNIYRTIDNPFGKRYLQILHLAYSRQPKNTFALSIDRPCEFRLHSPKKLQTASPSLGLAPSYTY